MLLPAFGYCGKLWELLTQENILHTLFIAFAQGNPLTIDDKMGIVAHALWFVFANQRGEFF